MSSAVRNSVGSQINFFVPRTPGVVVASREPAEQAAAAPKNATAENGPRVLTFALQRRPRATRASSNKVRTGCVTCKRRHVKCDEAKPSCQRCVKWKGFCTGYETSSNDSPASTPTPDAEYNCDATTEGQAVAGDDSGEGRPAEDVGLLPEPATAISFQDETERRYFDHWLDRRTRLGGGLFDERLWDETIPQLSRQHASVRYAIAAAGAIAKALNNSMRPTQPARMGANGPHYGAALSYYGRAIREVRRSRQMDTGSLRAAIVCCLLFVSFEVLHGDRRAAFWHINNGQRMMDELLRMCDGDPAQEGEEEEGGGRGNVIGAESVEVDVLHVFQRLIQQSWSCGVLRRRRRQVSGGPDGDDNARAADEPWCCRGGSGGRCVVDKMPASFATLQEARRWWDVTQHYVIHSSSVVLRIIHLGLGDDFLSECDERVRRHMDAAEKAGAGAKPSAATAATSPEQWRDFRDALERWRGGFEPLWEAAAKSRREDEKAYAQAALLRAHHLAMHGCVHAPLGCGRASVAQLTPAYREVVQLCGYLLAYQRRSFAGDLRDGGGEDEEGEEEEEEEEEVFTMDMGPTWPLLLAGTRCRDPGVRDEAVRLLRENPRRDGLWDSRMFYALTARNRVLEESNAREGGGLEEQWRRLQHRSAYVDEQGRLMARGLEKNASTGTWEFREDDLSRFLSD